MSALVHVGLAFISGIAIEALYALSVIAISDERKMLPSALFSGLWGVAFLVGVNESFKSYTAAALWCIGLGIGAAAGVRLKPKEVDKETVGPVLEEMRRLAEELRRNNAEANRIWKGQ